MTQPFRIVFPLYEGVTQLDFTGPHQVFSRLPGAEVTTASVGAQDITTDGLTFAKLADLTKVESCEMICVPGGFGCAEAMLDRDYMDAVLRLAWSAKYVTSVCTGSLILGAAGLLQGKRAACHWAWRDLLSAFGATPDAGRVVCDGNIFTGGGVTAGIDLGLAVAAEVAGDMVAQSIQLGIEYAPAPPFDSGRPELAAPEVLEAVSQRMATMLAGRQAAVDEAAARLKALA